MKRLKISLSLFASVILVLAGKGLVAQCPGSLVVNEISNGPSGTKEFVELVAASTDNPSCSGNSDTVDVSGWIVDDNNGLFSGASAVDGIGISQGHYRLADDPTWESFPAGKLLVLFNYQDFDSSVTAFNTAAGNPLNGGVLNTDSAIYVAVGISPLVVKFTASPAADSTGGDPNYCSSDSEQDPASNYAGMALRNACGGDGIQVRCPGCSPEQGLGEPAFFHGFSYGFDNDHQSNPNFLDAAHIAFDTVGVDTPLCGSTRTFYFNNGTVANAPGMDANWAFGGYDSDATPGAPNSNANENYIANVANATIQYSACDQPEEPTVGKGSLVVTEVSNGYEGSCEYVELLVSPCGGDSPDYVDVQGWILDDNNGDFSVPRGAGSGKAITTGHLRLAFNDTWDSVKVGSIIVLYNNSSDNNCYNFPTGKHTIPDTVDGNPVYWEPVGGGSNNMNIESRGTQPNSFTGQYCAGSYTAPATSWTGKVGLSNSGDAFQVRCPGCNDVNPGEPAFYHGFGYGTSTEWFTISRTAGQDLGGPVFNTNSSSSQTKYVFNGSTSAPYTISDESNWNIQVADSLGVITTAGKIGGDFITQVRNGAFTQFWPCCSSGGNGSSQSSSYKKAGEGSSSDNAGAGSAIVNRVYPNPAGDQLNIDVDINGKAQLSLLNINGQVVLSRELTAKDTKVSVEVSELPAGVYIYKLNSGSKKATGKVLIQ